MDDPEKIYHEVGRGIKGAEESQMFGKPCFKTGGKAFICFFSNCMVFKLTGEAHQSALSLPGSQLFDPSGKGRPMKEWVQVTYAHKDTWNKLAAEAFNYVKK